MSGPNASTPTNARLGFLTNNAATLRSKTYTNSAAMAVANAIVTSVSTSTSPQSYSGAGLNGSIGAGKIDLPQSVSATTSASGATYATGSTHKITVQGTDVFGNSITGFITLTMVGGGETVVALDANGVILGFASVTSISVPAQLGMGGAFTFGVRDVVVDQLTTDIRGGLAASNIVVGYSDGSTDTVPTELAEHLYLYGARIVFASSTAFPITVGI